MLPPETASSVTMRSSFPGSWSLSRCTQSVKIWLRSRNRNGQIISGSALRLCVIVHVPIVISGSLFRFFRHFLLRKGHCCETAILFHSIGRNVGTPYCSATFVCDAAVLTAGACTYPERSGRTHKLSRCRSTSGPIVRPPDLWYPSLQRGPVLGL